MTSPLFIIIGAPAVGKSATSRALASLYNKSLHIPIDDIRIMVRSGLVQPSDKTWDDELVSQVNLARISAIAMTERYRNAGFVSIIDDFLDPPLLHEYDRFENEANVYRIILRPDESTARKRNQSRSTSENETSYLNAGIQLVYGLIDKHHQKLKNKGWKFMDNTLLSIEETADLIKQMVNEPW